MCRKTDYPEFIKKPVKITTRQDKTYDAIVVDASYYVGITVVDANDLKRELMCINRSQAFHTASRDWQTGEVVNLQPMHHYKRAYSLLFYNAIEQIKSGHIHNISEIYTELMAEICGFTNDGFSGSATCAWK